VPLALVAECQLHKGFHMLRIGQINFINCLPINIPLARMGFANKLEYEIIEGNPAELNQMLRNQELDIAPISSYEFLSQPMLYKKIETLSISSKSYADSVLFFCNQDFFNNNKQTIHVTNKSASSIALLKIILKNVYAMNLDLIQFEKFSENKNYPAKLLIGDEALTENKDNYEIVLDLGERWQSMHSLPMVFGLWVCNKSSITYKDKDLFDFLGQEFYRLKEYGLNEIYPDIIIEAFKETGLSKTILNQYFQNLDYDFTTKHQQSLDLFSEHLQKDLAISY
jgi:chorismate dehydratase